MCFIDRRHIAVFAGISICSYRPPDIWPSGTVLDQLFLRGDHIRPSPAVRKMEPVHLCSWFCRVFMAAGIYHDTAGIFPASSLDIIQIDGSEYPGFYTGTCYY